MRALSAPRFVSNAVRAAPGIDGPKASAPRTLSGDTNERMNVLSASTHHMDVDYSCYEGRTVQGGSDVVISRGMVIVKDGAWLGHAGHGKFHRREPRGFSDVAQAKLAAPTPTPVG
jgi:hypothetical protein